MATKQNAAFAPVFQPMLGPIDEAAENLLRSRLETSIPTDPGKLGDFFAATTTPDRKPNAYLTERGRALKRLRVDRSPIMPTGLLLFCLDYEAKARDPVSGILTEVEQRFRDLRDSDLRDSLRRVYNFRNTYIAHEKGEQLTAQRLAEESLHQWVDVLVSLERLVPCG